jgi:hypothetical protein
VKYWEISTRVELEQLEQRALRHTSTEDRLVLEASGNPFAVTARLRTIGRKVEILDSHRVGKVYWCQRRTRFEECYQAGLKNFPERATSYGDYRYSLDRFRSRKSPGNIGKCVTG